MIVPLLFAVPFGPLLAWKRGDLLGAAQRLLAAVAIAAIGVATVFVINGGGPVLAPFAIGLALFVMVGALVDVAERVQFMRQPWQVVAPPRRGIAAFGIRHGAARISASGFCFWALSANPITAPSASQP